VIFQEGLVSGELEAANKFLDKGKKNETGKNRLLYFMNKGVVLQLMGNNTESNEYLEKAYIYTEDFRRNYALDAIIWILRMRTKLKI